MPTLDDALDLARAGWAVLPLRGKVPVTAHGVKDASTDPAQLAQWWPAGASHNIGARVPEKLLVLDFDPQNGGSIADLEAAAGVPLPATLVVHSGRGTGGQHRYYLHPGGRVTGAKLPHGIDVKTSTGYCVMPPSLHPLTGNPYRWEKVDPAPLPAAVRELLRPPSPTRANLPASPSSASDRLSHLVRYVEGLQEGNRNHGLYWAACRAFEEGHGDLAAPLLEHAAARAGLPASEARQTIASAQRAVISA